MLVQNNDAGPKDAAYANGADSWGFSLQFNNTQ